MRLRLTRRGRLLVVLVVAGLLFTAFSLGRVARSVTPSRHPAVRAVVVQPGDTLWSLARRVSPDGDARGTVERLREANHLSTGTVVPGETLSLP